MSGSKRSQFSSHIARPAPAPAARRARARHAAAAAEPQRRRPGPNDEWGRPVRPVRPVICYKAMDQYL